MRKVECEWCGGIVDPRSTCPRSLPCPACKALPGKPCRRPSGHRAPQLHAPRIQAAEDLDAEVGLTYDEPVRPRRRARQRAAPARS